jgi:pilus assembly protein CpaB
MIKRRGILMVVLSVALGLGAAWVANNWVNGRLTASAAPANTMPVVAAAIAIPFGTKVESRHLKLVEMPPGSVPDGHFDQIAEVEGQIAVQAALPGEILLKERFSEHTGGSTLSAIVSPKMRAVTVRVNDVIGVAGFLLPGNRVDVIASRMLPDRRAVSETILRDLKVLAVDQTARTEKDEPVVVRAVTLEMEPKQAEVLVKAREEGEIQLTLRNPLEEEPVKVAEAPAAAPAPVKHRAPVYRPTSSTVTIIRGTNVEKTKTRP